jgi:hypothetical protein
MSDLSTGIELLADDATQKWQAVAEEIRKEYGTSAVKNAVHAPTTP